MATSDDDLDVLAGEYVLGVLAAEERAAVERRLADHPELAQRIAVWHERLAPLAADLPEVTPRPQVWQQVRRSLTAVSPKHSVPWRSRLGLWRAWAGLATTAALGLLVAVLLLQRPTPQLVAVLSDSGGRPIWVVRASSEASRLLARPLAEPAPAATVPELWLIPTAGSAPISLGLLDPAASNRSVLAPETLRLLAPGATLAVSLEPPGGSPTDAPTGPVVSTGVLVPEPL